MPCSGQASPVCQAVLFAGWTPTQFFSIIWPQVGQGASAVWGRDQQCWNIHIQHLQGTISLLCHYFFTSSSRLESRGRAAPHPAADAAKPNHSHRGAEAPSSPHPLTMSFVFILRAQVKKNIFHKSAPRENATFKGKPHAQSPSKPCVLSPH